MQNNKKTQSADTLVCPSWMCGTFDNPLRRLFHDPNKILSPWITPGSTILDIGPGMGYFTLPLAQLAGKEGHVIAMDIQPAMLSGVTKRAAKFNLIDRISTKLSSPDGPEMQNKIDFTLTFWMVHEVPNQSAFIKNIHTALKDNGAWMLVEPKIHVTKSAFEKTVKIAEATGFKIKTDPGISLSRSLVFTK